VRIERKGHRQGRMDQKERDRGVNELKIREEGTGINE
jgi:hypothetical protein